MQLLVVGSTYESGLACRKLAGLSSVDKIWSLPMGPAGYAMAATRTTLDESNETFPGRLLPHLHFRNKWGHKLFTIDLPGFHVIKLTNSDKLPELAKIERLPASLSIVDTTPQDNAFVCVLSDGSELHVQGTLWATGTRPSAPSASAPYRNPSPGAVACWGFRRNDLLDLKAWEFRTALGKSLELLPLPEGLVSVRMRFKASTAPRQSACDLRKLFEEFGSDVEAILEDVADDDIHAWLEDDLWPNFQPKVGTIALGASSVNSPALTTFGWATTLAQLQVSSLHDSLSTGCWSPLDWNPTFERAIRPFTTSERYLRHALHYDNALIRPLRDTLLRWLPSSFLATQLKQHLSLPG